MTKECDEFDMEAKVNNSDKTITVMYSPADLNKDGVKTSVGAEVKHTPGKDEYEGKLYAGTGGHDAGPVVPWFEVSIINQIQFYLYSLNSVPIKPKSINY